MTPLQVTASVVRAILSGEQNKVTIYLTHQMDLLQLRR
jgi:hypothetical protein